MSEIYGSGGHDSGDDDASRPDRGYSSFGSGWGNPWRPDHSVYAILHEDDHLPDPRTRQEAARQDAARDEAPTLAQRAAETGDAKRGEHPYPVDSRDGPRSASRPRCLRNQRGRPCIRGRRRVASARR